MKHLDSFLLLCLNIPRDIYEGKEFVPGAGIFLSAPGKSLSALPITVFFCFGRRLSMKKKFTRIAAFIVVFVLLFDFTGTVAFASIRRTAVSKYNFSDCDTVTFGTYPQSEVKDTSLKASLSAAAEPTDAWTSYNYYMNGRQSDFMKYTDIELDGEKYRGIYFTSFRPSYTGTIGISNEQNDNGYFTSAVYWFKYEPLEWYVISSDASSDSAVLLCRQIVDSQDFYNSYDKRTETGAAVYPNNYAYSDIRTWLNDTFYNTAFSADEKTAINETSLDNSAYNSLHSRYDSNATKDNVWLLSYSETETDTSIVSSVIDGNGILQAKGTDYALSQGLEVHKINKYSSWRLRTAGHRSIFSCVVDSHGIASYDGYGVYDTTYGIRPCVTVRYSELNKKQASVVTAETIAEKLEGVKKDSLNGADIIVAVPGIKVSDILASEKNISVVDNDGNSVSGDTLLATGNKIILPDEMTVETVVLGDVDGDGNVSVADARLALRVAVRLDTLTGLKETAAKVGSEKIGVDEARQILRIAVKLDDGKELIK